MKRAYFVPVAIFALAAGCGSSVDQGSAVKVMTAAMSGTGQAQAKLMPAGTATSASFNGTITNPSGSGSAEVSGSTTSTGNSFTLVFDIDYVNWHDLAGNVTLNGTLHENANFSSLNPPSGTASISGAVSATGSVDANVGFDIEAAYSAGAFKVTGNVGGNTISVQGG